MGVTDETHARHVADYAADIYDRWAKKRSFPRSEIDRNKSTLRKAAMLHDVGKTTIPDQILKKQARLTDHEFQLMKLHTVHGARILAGCKDQVEEAAVQVALCHHERWDGTGYPQGKRSDRIPLFARIVGLVDVYDALLSDREYKTAWPELKARAAIRAGAGGHFDPELVDMFLEILQ